MRISLIFPYILHIGLSVFAEPSHTELDLLRCQVGDFITQSTHHGQGHDRLEITKKLPSGVCELEYTSEVEGGFSQSICQFGNKSKTVSFADFPNKRCEIKKAGNAFEGMAQLREKGCGNFPIDKCPSERCYVMKTCDGHKFCYEVMPNDRSQCGSHGYYGQRVACCSGLKLSCPGATVTPWSKTQKMYVVPYCLNCGNKICEPPENSKNCPSDCH